MIIEGNKEKRVMNLDALKMLFKIIDHSSISVQPRIEAIKKIQVCLFFLFSLFMHGIVHLSDTFPPPPPPLSPCPPC